MEAASVKESQDRLTNQMVGQVHQNATVAARSDPFEQQPRRGRSKSQRVTVTVELEGRAIIFEPLVPAAGLNFFAHADDKSREKISVSAARNQRYRLESCSLALMHIFQ